MAWILDDTRPIYLQIEDLIKTNIIAGVYQPGQKLPSVRDLAAEASVNPNTMRQIYHGGYIENDRIKRTTCQRTNSVIFEKYGTTRAEPG